MFQDDNERFTSLSGFSLPVSQKTQMVSFEDQIARLLTSHSETHQLQSNIDARQKGTDIKFKNTWQRCERNKRRITRLLAELEKLYHAERGYKNAMGRLARTLDGARDEAGRNQVRIQNWQTQHSVLQRDCCERLKRLTHGSPEYMHILELKASIDHVGFLPPLLSDTESQQRSDAWYQRTMEINQDSIPSNSNSEASNVVARPTDPRIRRQDNLAEREIMQLLAEVEATAPDLQVPCELSARDEDMPHVVHEQQVVSTHPTMQKEQSDHQHSRTMQNHQTPIQSPQVQNHQVVNQSPPIQKPPAVSRSLTVHKQPVVSSSPQVQKPHSIVRSPQIQKQHVIIQPPQNHERIQDDLEMELDAPLERVPHTIGEICVQWNLDKV